MSLWTTRSTSRSKFLAEILKDRILQDSVAFKKPEEENFEKNLRDAKKIVEFSRTSGYADWSFEAWNQVVSCIDKLMDDRITESEASFYRGNLAGTLDLLRVSGKAESLLRGQREEEKET